MSVATTAEGQPYPPQYAVDPGGSSGYPPHEASVNGTINHGLPAHPYEHPPVYPPAHPGDYGHSPITAGHPYGTPINPYAVSFAQANSRPIKKGNRATQVCRVIIMAIYFS